MPIKKTLSAGRVPVKIWTEQIEPAAMQQLENVSRLPIIHSHVAAMPDVHLGIGATVGSVIPTYKAIVPAAVGVDIGCGMVAAQTTLKASQLTEASLQKVFDQISRDVPVGRGEHRPERAAVERAKPFSNELNQILELHPELAKGHRDPDTWVYQLGSLGTGNHFIEVCIDENDSVWIMLHSGSRGVGNRLGTYFISLAREEMLKQDAHLPDKDLAYFEEGTQYFGDYVKAVGWAQRYAKENRQVMLDAVIAAMKRHLPEFAVDVQVIDCHHNYVERETHFGEEVWVTRKGAIRSSKGRLGIVPGSMGTRSYIVRGKGNPESFESSAHGAGRSMSRTAAQKRFTVGDLQKQTEGVVCRKDVSVLDEIPAAYKDIDVVMANQEDLVEVVHTLKQVLCVKG
jgi:tRNA-splicing ligase RtcB